GRRPPSVRPALRLRARPARRRRHGARARREARPRPASRRRARRGGVGGGAQGNDPRHRVLPADPMSEPPKEPVKYVEANVRLPYHYVAGDSRARYLLALKDKKILGSKCSTTGKVFVPPLVASPESFAPCEELVQVADRGVVTTFCIVRIPVIGRNVELPYVAASVALDGADIPIFALVQARKPGDVRLGMRGAAV